MPARPDEAWRRTTPQSRLSVSRLARVAQRCLTELRRQWAMAIAHTGTNKPTIMNATLLGSSPAIQLLSESFHTSWPCSTPARSIVPRGGAHPLAHPPDTHELRIPLIRGSKEGPCGDHGTSAFRWLGPWSRGLLMDPPGSCQQHWLPPRGARTGHLV